MTESEKGEQQTLNRVFKNLGIYIVIFGLGSIGGMMLMSALVGLPLRLTANRFVRANLTVRGAAGLFSLGFGLFMVYQIGFVDGLFR